jgi:hypothetical protein
MVKLVGFVICLLLWCQRVHKSLHILRFVRPHTRFTNSTVFYKTFVVQMLSAEGANKSLSEKGQVFRNNKLCALDLIDKYFTKCICNKVTAFEIFKLFFVLILIFSTVSIISNRVWCLATDYQVKVVAIRNLLVHTHHLLRLHQSLIYV